MGRQFKFFFATFFCLLLIAGCSSKPKLKLEPEKPIPDWYISPPANTPELLTGVGGGKTLKEATDAALSNLVSRLGVSIESKFESITQKSRYTYSNKSTSYIKSEVSKIRVSNYDLAFSEKIKFNEFLVMVQSSRTNFIEDLTQQIDDKLNAEKLNIKTSANDNALKRFHVAKTAADNAVQLEPTIIILSSMDPDFNNAFYQKQIQELKKKSEEARRKIIFVINTDSSSKAAATPIKNALSQQSFRVGMSSLRDGVLVVDLQTSTQYNQSSGIQIAEIQMDLRVTDHRGRLIGSNSVGLTGHATRGYDMAKAAAIDKINEEIEKQGIAQLLGIEL